MTSEIDHAPAPAIQGRPLRLFCDEMLLRLARWLRAAGHDTQLAVPRENDAAILARALAERRWLITRDRGFLQRRGAAGVILLTSQQVDEQARILRRELALDWLYAPFSRCLLCNTPLQEVAVAAADKPAARYCPRCDKLYWQGSHVRRMQARLAIWQRAE